jgi:uncharacterized damage-inducible protein DinB
MDDPYDPYTPLAALHTRLWRNCLDGVSDALAWERPDPRANDFGFIALHLVDARVYLANFLDFEVENPFGSRYEKVRTTDDLKAEDRPAMAELRAGWDAVSEALLERLPGLTAEDLAKPAEAPFPIQGTVGAGLTFLLHHEAYHLGQLGLLRKFLGLDSMRYDG